MEIIQELNDAMKAGVIVGKTPLMKSNEPLKIQSVEADLRFKVYKALPGTPQNKNQFFRNRLLGKYKKHDNRKRIDYLRKQIQAEIDLWKTPPQTN